MNLSIGGSQQIGAANISTYLSGLLTGFKTQHNFGTQKIDISEDGKSAVAITSFTGTFWTIDADPPMYAQYFQQYNDTLEEIDGAWLISNKVVSYMTPPLGNLTLQSERH
ncbi:hypothetical protein ZTR_01286 [Talaromyces verruculosus]|nr:hypothetical protein ZTR_01286 [Talaromyces verruculosus]